MLNVLLYTVYQYAYVEGYLRISKCYPLYPLFAKWFCAVNLLFIFYSFFTGKICFSTFKSFIFSIVFAKTYKLFLNSRVILLLSRSKWAWNQPVATAVALSLFGNPRWRQSGLDQRIGEMIGLCAVLDFQTSRSQLAGLTMYSSSRRYSPCQNTTYVKPVFSEGIVFWSG